MHIKQKQRQRRAKRALMRIKRLGIEKGTHRLKIHRTPKHIYAQIIAPQGGSILAQASSLDADIRGEKFEGGKKAIAQMVGKLIAERAKAAGVKSAAFDKAGFKYHGRVAALADAARESGLDV